jgi:hypothetical protein
VTVLPKITQPKNVDRAAAERANRDAVRDADEQIPFCGHKETLTSKAPKGIATPVTELETPSKRQGTSGHHSRNRKMHKIDRRK